MITCGKKFGLPKIRSSDHRKGLVISLQVLEHIGQFQNIAQQQENSLHATFTISK